VGYRDDHEAALARVNALEEELARERTDEAERDARLSALEAELRGAREKLAAAEVQLEELKPPARPAAKPAPAPAPAPARAGDHWLLFSLIAGAAVIGIVIAVTTSRSDHDHDEEVRLPPPPPRVAAMPDRLSTLLEEARRRAQELLPGSRIIEMRGEGIDEEGRLHPEYGSVLFRVHRTNPPAAPSFDEDRPIGAPQPEPPPHEPYSCVTMTYGPGGWDEPLIIDGEVFGYCAFGESDANDDAIAPACTAKSIWVMARRDGAPAGAIAAITYDGRWTLRIADRRASFERDYDDDCTAP
jgi:hypothetical protein